MITKGQVEEVLYTNNKLKVRVPIFETAGSSIKSIVECTVCHEPGIIDGYKIGDIVYVAFENNLIDQGVVIGKLYIDKDKAEDASYASLNNLKVTEKVVLPSTTTIGSINFQKLSEYFNFVNNTIDEKDISVNSIQFQTKNDKAGKVYFNDNEGVIEVTLSPNVTMAVGVDAVLKVYNNTAETLTDGQIVYLTSSTEETTSVALAIGSNYGQAERVMGVVTESIDSGNYGFVTKRGFVGSLVLDPAIYDVNDALYLSSTVAGEFTNVRPISPNFITKIGYVTKVSSNSSAADGQIYVDVVSVPVAADIIYDNEYITEEDFRLDSKNVQDAIDELQLNKADISMLSSNITLYRTLVDSDVVGYKKLVTSTADSDYPVEATAVSSGAITTTDQYIAGAISPANLFVGNPGQINIFSIGRVRKASGNNNQNAEFFFRIYKRDSAGIETLLATSAVTGVVSSTKWLTFNAIALLNNGNFVATDRIVVKSYANVVGIAGGTFEYEFGGINPFRLLIPVPVSVISASVASAIFTDTTNFDKILSHLDINVQKSLETLDNHSHTDATTSESGFMSTTDKIALNELLSSKTAKTFLAAPNAEDGAPTFREIIAADIPTLNQDTTGNAKTATKLATARTFTITDNDATNSQTSATNFDGSNDFTIKLPATIKASIIGSASENVIKNTAITAATKTKISYDAKGLVTSGDNLSKADIPDIDATQVIEDTTHRFVTDDEKISWNSGVTTVSLASGTNDGTLKLTVNGTATDNIAVTGLGSAAYTDSTNYVPTTRKVNNKGLSENITLSLDDVNDGTTRKLSNYVLTSGGTITGALNFSNSLPTCSINPTTDSQFTNRAYVDTALMDAVLGDLTIVYPITWSQLKAKRDSGTLKPGLTYRITDYTTTTAQADTQSANHAFDIIVVADSPTKLNEDARAVHSEGDTILKGITASIATGFGEAGDVLKRVNDNDNGPYAWGTDADISDGDTSGFVFTQSATPSVGDDAWCDGEYGVVVSRVEEDYFANSKLESWKIKYCLDNDTDRFAWANTVNGKGVIYRMIDEFNNDCPYDFKNIRFLVSGEYLYTFNYYAAYEDEEYDLSLNQYMLFDFLHGQNTTTEIGCHTNIIKPYYNQTDGTDLGHGHLQFLNFIIFRNFAVSDGDEGLRTHCCYSNFFDFGCRNISFGKCCSLNSFGCDCRDITIGDNCNYNRFGKNNRSNTLGDTCNYISFDDFCEYNTIGHRCYYNTFGNNCSNNTFGNDCSYNTFGTYCNNNYFGNSCSNNIFGNSCRYLQISDNTNTQKRYISVDSGVQGDLYANKFDLYDAAILNKNYQVTFKKSSSGKYLMLWATDTGTMTGKYKSNNTDTTWKNIV